MKVATKKTRKSTSTSTASNGTKKARKQSKAQRAAVERHRLDPKLFIIPVAEGNPRREKSIGWKSYQVILKHRKPITVEQFQEEGGRLRDLHWDSQKGNVKLSRKAS